MDFHPAAGWQIRPFRPGPDRAGCERVFQACVGEFSWLDTAQSLPAGWSSPGCGLAIHVAEVRQAGLVGFIMFNSETGYVSYLLVERDWRLCGIGRGFLAGARGMTSRALSLDVDRQNGRARAAYEALGFQPVATRTAAGREQIRMRAA